MRQTMARAKADPVLPPWRFTSLTEAPLMLTLVDLTQIYRCSDRFLRKQIKRGLFPEPALLSPMRWRKEDIEADLARLGAEAAKRASRRRRSTSKRKQ